MTDDSEVSTETFEDELSALEDQYGLSDSEHAEELAKAVADLQD